MSEQINNSQREELHRTIWQIANDLRGAVDGWDFKQYVLGMLFYRYISENLRDYVNKYEREISGPDFDYAKTSDELAEKLREELVRTKGFFILPSELFQNMRKNAPNDPDLNITLGKVFRNIENSTKGTASEENFEGLFDEMDVNSAKLGASVKERNLRLIRLLDSIGDMPLGRLQDNNIDAFGDAYEFLMGMYASSAGKSGGEFFTPQEVSELVAKLTVIGKSSVNKVYDPACGSGKTLTSFKTAQLATEIEGIEKVLFVVDRKDLDYQTIVEYEKFQKGAANGNTSTKVLQGNLEDPSKKILVTTIQKLDRFIALNRSHPIYKKHVVIIFDECHRSQFGAMHKAITRAFSNYHLFGFTGTPIFASNAPTGIKAVGATTEQVFGERLHSYTIVDAINDGNVLPFRIDYLNTVKMKDDIVDAKVPAIDIERAMMAPERISEVSEYLLDHFEQKTKRDSHYFYDDRKLAGFNAIFAVASIPMAKAYYSELKRQMALRSPKLKIGLIYSFNPNEDLESGLPDESFDTESLDQSSRDFLDEAIADYNRMFNTNYDSSSKNFENYYKDLSRRVKQREVDLLLVVNMFLTGFDATTLNTLWVDKNLRQHGLIQAFSRTNRILNSVKTFGNIVCFRDLKQETDDAIALFGNKDAGGIVLLKTFEEYYETGFLEKGRHQPSYLELVGRLTSSFPLGVEIRGEEAQREFIRLYGSILRVRNILQAFDEFAGKDVLSERELQDYQSIYLDLYQDLRVGAEAEKVVINDDLVFEIELIKQIEVNLDYILMLVARYQESKLEDKEILTTIDRSINASLELRSKKDLIQGFIDRVNMQTDIEKDWPEYVAERKEKELLALIKEESLHEEPTRRFVENAFRDKEMRTIGPAIDAILPPISFFDPARATKKQTVIDKLLAFFERFLGLAGES